MVNNNNVSKILVVGNQNPPIKTEEKIKRGVTICFVRDEHNKLTKKKKEL